MRTSPAGSQTRTTTWSATLHAFNHYFLNPQLAYKKSFQEQLFAGYINAASYDKKNSLCVLQVPWTHTVLINILLMTPDPMKAFQKCGPGFVPLANMLLVAFWSHASFWALHYPRNVFHESYGDSGSVWYILQRHLERRDFVRGVLGNIWHTRNATGGALTSCVVNDLPPTPKLT